MAVRVLLLLSPLLAALALTPRATRAAEAPVDFALAVRPVLSRLCFACHGPDAAHRKAGLRLDTEAGARKDLGGSPAFAPGDPARSEALARMRSTDPDELMPPPETGKRATAEEIALVERWVREGARMTGHWSLQAPRRPVVPPAFWPELTRNPIDHFVQARLPEARLAPAPQAPPAVLVRRLALDLTGLPPEPDDVARFSAAPGEGAWRALVERYLASPAYGERWARVWLDLARYADSKGYEKDRPRVIWRYRDWVIEAFNQDMPYDRFTVLQLAGDLVPGASARTRLPTAFHRNTMTNDEGGTDDEEFRVAAVKDRVDTTMQVWMGLTVGCAKCHDHKYDPVTIDDYYRLYAFFNQTADSDAWDDQPLESFPTAEQARRIAELERAVAASERALWTAARRRPAFSRFRADLARRHAGPVATLARTGGLHPALWQTWRRVGPFLRADGDPLARAFPPETQPDALAPERQFEGGELRWSEVNIASGAPYKLPADRPGTYYLVARFALDRALEVRFTLSGPPLRAWLDGTPLPVRDGQVAFDRELPAGEHALLVKLVATERAAEDAPLLFTRAPERLEGTPVPVLATSLGARPGERPVAVAEYFLREVDGPRHDAALLARLDARRAELRALREQAPRIPVLRELPADRRRPSHLHLRGDFLSPGAAVTPGVPASLHPMPAGAPLDRLGLARWLTARDNPLFARVAVNRVWAQLFGRGLVETEEDFGAQGSPPSHPELLDWLATELVRLGYSQKALLRLLVTSHTYRQDAAASSTVRGLDPYNRLLARGPRFRLEAEMVRDASLAVAGLLGRKRLGPPVMPWQPPGLWRSVYSELTWTTSPGEDRHRRALYTFVKRTTPYPSWTLFDAPSREVCTVRRLRTNTPLQALVTLNDPVYVEAAQALARRMVSEAGDTAPGPRIALGFRLVTGRPPGAEETATLHALYVRRLTHYRTQPEQARALVEEPLGPLPAALRARVELPELAALVTIANVLLNLDEFVNKG